MSLFWTLGNKTYRVDQDASDLSIPLEFNGEQPSAFGAPPATSKPYAAGDFIGDRLQGGAVNCFEVSINPHCNGTHTECLGHITEERYAIRESLRDAFIPATLITVELKNGADVSDRYSVDFGAEDQVITKAAIDLALSQVKQGFGEALILRTSDETIAAKRFQSSNAPFFSMDAMELIISRGIQHLLIDSPSIDRLEDEGHLACHHLFFGLSHSKPRLDATVTEFVSIPRSILDGSYLLNLQIAPLVLDVSPSRPLIFGVEEL